MKSFAILAAGLAAFSSVAVAYPKHGQDDGKSSSAAVSSAAASSSVEDRTSSKVEDRPSSSAAVITVPATDLPTVTVTAYVCTRTKTSSSVYITSSAAPSSSVDDHGVDASSTPASSSYPSASASAGHNVGDDRGSS